MWSALTRSACSLRTALRTADPDADLPGLDAQRIDALAHAVLGRTLPDVTTPHATRPQQQAQPGTQAQSQTQPQSGTQVQSQTQPQSGTQVQPSDRRATQPHRSVPRCSCGGAQTAAVVVDMPTLLHLADNPGYLAGYGTIPADLARIMAADRDWVRWTTEPGTRHLIDRGAQTYRPSSPLRAFVIARDRVCGFPGCQRPARECDCDHVVAYRTPDGRTIEVNLGPLCRQHHNAKTHGRWQLRYDPVARTKTWRSPLGKTYVAGTDPPLA